MYLCLLKTIKIMATSYSGFTYEDLDILNIKVERKRFLPNNIPTIEPSEWLKTTLKKNLNLPLASEKAKCEHIIAPILTEMVDVNEQSFTYFSGYTFDVDKSRGLKGRCDFMLTGEPLSPRISAPVFTIVEAKNDNLDIGVPQCIAQMYAALLFNQKRNRSISVIYGAVSFGFEWQFLKLVDENTALIDPTIYYQIQLPQLLGALQYIIQSRQS
jgi:hypothetical protein